MNQYEGMFLFDPTFGASFENCETEVRRLAERAGAELIFCRKWDERRLAYRIKGRKRGVYVLTYFKASPNKIGGLERDAKLSENILRVLIVRAEGVTHEMMESACGARGEERTPARGEAAEGGDSASSGPEKPAAETGGDEVSTEGETVGAVRAEVVAASQADDEPPREPEPPSDE